MAASVTLRRRTGGRFESPDWSRIDLVESVARSVC